MIDKDDPRLTAFLLDELDPSAAAEVQAELDAAPELREHVDGLRETIGTLQHVLHVADDQPAFTEAQMEQIDDASQSAVGIADVTNDNRRIRWRNLVVAALVLYAVGLSVFVLQQPITTALTGPSAIEPVAAPAVTSSAVDDTKLPDLTRRIQPSGTREIVLNPGRRVPTSTNGLDIGGEVLPDSELSTAVPSRHYSNAPEFLPLENGDGYVPADERPSSNENLNGVIGDAEVQFVPELGRMILRGNEQDVDRIREIVERDGGAIGGQGFSGAMNRGTLGAAVDEMLSLLDEDETQNGQADDFIDRSALEETRRRLSNSRLLESNVDGSEPPDISVRPVESRESEEMNDIRRLERWRVDIANKAKEISAASGKISAATKTVKTWKPATAATNRARLSVGHHDDLELAARDTYVRIDGFRARVFFDCYYYNDRPQQLEGQFMLRLPNDASLHYFAFGPTTLPTPDAPPATGKPGNDAQQQTTAAETAVQALRGQTLTTGSDLARRSVEADFMPDANSIFGRVKPARVAPRQKAALAYDETVRRRVDPALVEWAGPGIFQTRVFPLVPNQLHRIIVGYDITLTDDGEDRVFSLDLPEGESGGRVEFDVAAAAGTQATIVPETDPFISGKRAYYRYENAAPCDYTVRLAGIESTVLTGGTPGTNDEYFATRLTADLPDAEAKSASRRAVFLLDTSWSERPAGFSKRLLLLKNILSENRDSIDEFAVLMFNVEQRWWKTKFVSNNDKNLSAFLATADTIALEGATDLHSALDAAVNIAWKDQQAQSLPPPNYFLLSDASATWGKTDLASLADPLRQVDRASGGGALFSYYLAGHRSDRATLQWLADAAGGGVFDVVAESDLAAAATAHRSRPWQIVNVSAAGADEVLIRGAARTVYPGQTLTVAGRGQLSGPLRIEFQRGSEKKTLEYQPRLSIASPAAARLYGQLAVEQLEPYADDLQDITVAFARHFRVPGRTCSMVMLDGAADYKRFGVNVSPADDQLVIASTSVISTIDQQETERLSRRQNPRKRFIAWLDSLQTSSLLNMPTALRLAIGRLPDQTFGFNAKPLNCQAWRTDQLSDSFVEQLRSDAPAFAEVMQEAKRKLMEYGADDAIKTASTLVEAKPSDTDTLRSVAFRAIEWQRSDQAAPLLWRLVQARPYQPQCLLLLARAMSESDDTDSAIVCYDLVCSGNWNQRWSGAKEVAQVELLHLLEKVDSGEIKSAIPHYARARLRQLRDAWANEGFDVAVVMHWNTDRTDVDLHVTEPGGEECFYSHNRTKSGGRLTQDITQGLGPEMYSLETAPAGEYKIEAKYYNSDNNRTQAPTETLLTVFQNIGRTNSQSQTKGVTLEGKGEKQTVMTVSVKH